MDKYIGVLVQCCAIVLGHLVPEQTISFDYNLPLEVVRIRQGSNLTRDCSVFGVPLPIVRWARAEQGGASLQNRPLFEEGRNEGKPRLELSVAAARLDIPCAGAADAGDYVCEAWSGDGKNLIARTVRLEIVEEEPIIAHERHALCLLSRRLSGKDRMPFIHLWTDTRMEGPENAAQLLCRATGDDVSMSWFRVVDDDSREAIHDGEGYTILPSGDLVITAPLSDSNWRLVDCEASNEHGTDTRRIFHMDVLPE